jgi:hypothetical protein
MWTFLSCGVCFDSEQPPAWAPLVRLVSASRPTRALLMRVALSSRFQSSLCFYPFGVSFSEGGDDGIF